MTLYSCADRSIHHHTALGLSVGSTVHHGFGRLTIQGVADGTHPVNTLGVGVQELGEPEPFSVEAHAARCQDVGVLGDGDAVGLLDDGEGIEVVKWNNASGKGVDTSFDGVCVPDEVRAGSSRDVDVVFRVNIAVKPNEHLVDRIYLGRGESPDEGSRPIGLGVNLGADIRPAPGRDVHASDGLENGVGSHLDPGKVRFGPDRIVGAHAGKGSTGRESDLAHGDNVVLSAQGKTARVT